MADKTDDKDETADKATPAKAEASAKVDESDEDEDDEDESDEDESDEDEKPAAKVEARKPEPKKPEPKKPEPKKPEAKKSEPAKKPAVSSVKKPSTPKADKVKDTGKAVAAVSVDQGVAPKAVHLGGESLVDRILPHLKKIMVGAVFLAVILTAVFAVKWWRERKREKATEGMQIVLEIANRPVIAKPDAKNPVPSFPTAKDRAAAVLAALDSEGVDLGHAFRGGFLLDAGQFDAAIAEYQECRSREDIQGVLCREDLGIAQEAKALAGDAAGKQAGFETALETFKTMQPDDQGPRYAYALYHQGRLNITLTKYGAGKELLERAKAIAGNTDLTMLINRRLETIPQ